MSKKFDPRKTYEFRWMWQANRFKDKASRAGYTVHILVPYHNKGKYKLFLQFLSGPAIEFPGLDDVDHLYSGSFEYEDGSETYSAYIMVAEGPDGFFYAQTMVDGGSWTDGSEEIHGPYLSADEACRSLSGAFDPLYENAGGQPIEFCENTQRALDLA